jgi:hypothetical protein
MSETRPGFRPYGSPTALLAEARRDELLRAAGQARLAAQVPRAGHGLLGAIYRALALGRRRGELSTGRRDSGVDAQRARRSRRRVRRPAA